MKYTLKYFFLTSFILLAACATTLNVTAPSNIDLTGHWVAEQQNDPKTTEPLSLNGKPIRLPIITTPEVSIEQSKGSMGMKFPNSYNKYYRDVDWGVKRKLGSVIRAGWKANDLVIMTKGRKMSSTEIYTLDSIAKKLYVKVSLSNGKKINRVFNFKN